MAGSKQVNLDAMIPRADFAVIEDGAVAGSDFQTLGTKDLRQDGIMPFLRKPDFQRETNHWTPQQISTLIQSFVDGDLIPSVILWKTAGAIFVIDGGHRLSVLRAWIEDDYGDKAISQTFFGFNINENQRKMAEATRKLVAKEVGAYKDWLNRADLSDLPPTEKVRALSVRSRTVPVQWVTGDAERAQASFLKINTQGTPLDDIEMLLIRNRKRPAAIAARSIIRAGMGHKYWSAFPKEKREQIEAKAKELYEILFEPDLDSKVKTLDFPVGGGAGVRTALRILVDFVLVASRDQQGDPAAVSNQAEDETGEATIYVLDRTLRLAKRITGNDNGSLGLHPAVYFYGPTGTHMGALFMGMATLIAGKLENNDKQFFKRFSAVRKELEELLLMHKRLLAAIIQNTYSPRRYEMISDLLIFMVDRLEKAQPPEEQEIADAAGVGNKVLTGQVRERSSRFSDETKNAVMIRNILASALHCSICGGYLHQQKSVSYDHIVPVRDGGLGDAENCSLTHHYCNQSVKN